MTDPTGPASAAELLNLVRKSGVTADKRLDAFLQEWAVKLPDDAKGAADLLVNEGVITAFQAEQLLEGKWRRFTIGKYRVLGRIGSGGMSSVFLCEHKHMRRRAAVKVLPTSMAEDPAALERFYLEARAVAALDHPNIVRAYDVDQDDDLHYLVMEYVDGPSLHDVIKKSGPLAPSVAADYARQAATGLQHAHESAGLVHRDIKPGNLVIDRTGIVKILDLGLAKFFHEEEGSITQKYDETVLGTADYLAPEQVIDSHTVDIRADIYSLGATLYFCLTGKAPFAEGTISQKLIWHQTRQPKSVRQLRKDVSVELEQVLRKMMAKDPNERYQTPGEAAEALTPLVVRALPVPAAEAATATQAASVPAQARQAAGGKPGTANPAVRTQTTRTATLPNAPALRPARPAREPDPAGIDTKELYNEGDTERPGRKVRRSKKSRPDYLPWLIGGAIGAAAGMLILLVLWLRR